jgi:ubiquinone/menaquinone biosynthesis C-methylase UbiE
MATARGAGYGSAQIGRTESELDLEGHRRSVGANRRGKFAIKPRSQGSLRWITINRTSRRLTMKRALTPGRCRRWQGLLSAHVDRTAISLVVDLGCGTGRFSGMLAAELSAPVIGLDPSEKMIDRARRKSATGTVLLGRAAAYQTPLLDGCVDLVFMSQVYHHLRDPAAAARECRRVLRMDGNVRVHTGTRENDVVKPRFFPAVRAMLDADLPSSDDVMANFAAAGFTLRHHEIVIEAVAQDWPSFVHKSAFRADSFLARLSDTEFHQGMAALRTHLANTDANKPVSEEIDWFVFCLPARCEFLSPSGREARRAHKV